MAFGTIGQFLASSSKASSSTSVTLTTNTANLTAGRLGIIMVGKDNFGTTDAASSEVTSITDAAGNTWSKFDEYRNGNGASNAGAVSSVWYTIATSNLGSSANVTINFANNTSAKAARGWVFSLGAGSTVSVDGVAYAADDDTGDLSSMSISGLSSKERIWIRCVASEWDFSLAITQTSGFTPISVSGTGGGLSDANMCSCGEFKISTSTGETSAPSTDFVDQASVFLAISEVVPSGVFSKPLVRSFALNRSNLY